MNRLVLLAFILMAPILIAASEPSESDGPPERSEIAAEFQWMLSDMYGSEKEWNEHYRQIEQLIDQFSQFKGTAGDSPEALLKILELQDQIDIQLDKIYAYASHQFDQDMRQSSAQALRDRAATLAVRYGEAKAWLAPELTSLPDATLERWLQGEDLRPYAHYFDDLVRRRAHILSPREEGLLASASKATGASANTFSLLTNTELKHQQITDAQGKQVTVTSPVYYDLIYSKDRRVRRDVYLALHRSYGQVKNSLASTLEGACQRDWFYAKARGYDSALAAALDDENLPVSVYHNLIETVHKHLPLLHRYTALRKRVLGLEELHPYDLYVSLVDAPEPRYSYEQAVALVLKGLQPMGDEYVDALEHGFRSGWIDVYENKGKRTGAYCGGTYLVHPVVLLNFKGNYNGVSTLAHEMGHAMQSHFANTTQPPVYRDYPMFTAEVASTAAEIVFKQDILRKTTDPRQQAMMIYRMLEDIRQTVFRQTRFAEFDLAIHTMAEEGEPMTAEVLTGKSREIFQKYYGPQLVLDSESDVECLRVPHHYFDYYVYRYATSYSAAAAVAKRIMDRESDAMEDWMRFLKTGNSMYALDMLEIAGADMSTPKPIEDCMAMFVQWMERLERLLDELDQGAAEK